MAPLEQIAVPVSSRSCTNRGGRAVTTTTSAPTASSVARVRSLRTPPGCNRAPSRSVAINLIIGRLSGLAFLRGNAFSLCQQPHRDHLDGAAHDVGEVDARDGQGGI